MDSPKNDFSDNDSKSRVSRNEEVRYHINIGEKDNYDWRSLKDLIKGTLSLTGDEIFHVDVMKNFSFFSSGPDERDNILEGFKSINIDNRDIEVSITEKFNSKKANKSKSKNREKGGFSRRSKPNPFKFSNNKKSSRKKR